ncbi:MAG: hypothetical protein ACXWC9_01980, partial [Pseudobdellovibrionaceae bacterium]
AYVHLILNHIPVLGALGVLALVALAMFKKDEAIVRLTFQLMVFIGVLSLPVYLTGEPAEEVIEHLPGVIESIIERHERFALFSLISTEILALIGLVGLVLVKKRSQTVSRYWKLIGAVALLNAMLMGITANYGGEIRHTEIRSNGDMNSPIDKNESETHESKDP